MTVIIFIVVLATLVLVHELGHFVAARRNGVKVEEFGLGFPPRLFSYQGKQTLYSINLIPLGGFVKIKGEAGEHKDHKDSYSNKKPWQRAIILSAGVLMNLLAAWILFSIGLTLGSAIPIDGVPIPTAARVKEINIQISNVLPQSPAEKSGIQLGDIIKAVDGQQFDNIEAVQNYVSQQAEKTLTITVRRGSEIVNINVTPEILPLVNRHALGVGLVRAAIVSFPWHIAVIEGFKRTAYITKEISIAFYQLLEKVLVGRPVSGEISGPIGIAVITGQIARQGLVYLLQFTAILSINLAIINFLPFPALDGGRMLFLVIEKVRGKPVSKKAEALIHNVGFLILIFLMILVTINDFNRHGKIFFSNFKNLF